MSLLLLLNPKQFNVVGGHFPTVYVPLWKKKKRKKDRSFKALILQYMEEERPASKLPKSFVREFAKAVSTDTDRVLRDWAALMAAKRAENEKRIQREDEELILIYFSVFDE